MLLYWTTERVVKSLLIQVSQTCSYKEEIEGPHKDTIKLLSQVILRKEDERKENINEASVLGPYHPI